MKIGTQDVDGTVDKVDTGSNKVTVKPTNGGTPFMIDMPAQGQPIVTKAITDEEYDRWQEISKMVETADPQYSHVGLIMDKDEERSYFGHDNIDNAWWSEVFFDLPITDQEKEELVNMPEYQDEFQEKIQKDLIGKADKIVVVGPLEVVDGKIKVSFAMGRHIYEDDFGRELRQAAEYRMKY